MNLLAELKRRNVIRAVVLYVGAVWALAQGIAQLGPSVGAPDWVTRAFLAAAAIGLPFWIAFSWFYAWTRDGLKRESELPVDATPSHAAGRKLDFAIIGVLALAVVLLLTNTLMSRGPASRGVTGTAGTQVAAPTVSSAHATPSIAVLPLANVGGNTDDQYFSDGLSENLITALSQFGGLKVISRNSAFQFRDSKQSAADIGRALGVAHLLEGSVRRLGDTVRINATLVLASDGSTVWSQRYDRPYKDLFKLQDEIAASVADALKAKLVDAALAAVQDDRPPNGDLAAYNAYLRGTFIQANNGTHARFGEAIALYRDAIARDPGYAQAWAAMANARALDAGLFLSGDAARAGMDDAQSMIDHALALAPDSAFARAIESIVIMNRERDYVQGERAAQRSVALSPTSFGYYAHALARLGLGDAVGSEALLRKAIALDPLSAQAWFWMSINLGGQGRLEEAQAAIERVLQLRPDNPPGEAQRVFIAVLRGDHVVGLAQARAIPPGNWRDIAVAMASQRAGTTPDARAAADAALKTVIATAADGSAFQIAEVYAYRGEPDHMFLWLDRAWNSRDSGMRRLLTDPFIAPYKTDPRFAAFCRKANLPLQPLVAIDAATGAR